MASSHAFSEAGGQARLVAAVSTHDWKIPYDILRINGEHAAGVFEEPAEKTYPMKQANGAVGHTVSRIKPYILQECSTLRRTNDRLSALAAD